jgi:hypothetical protein
MIDLLSPPDKSRTESHFALDRRYTPGWKQDVDARGSFTVILGKARQGDTKNDRGIRRITVAEGEEGEFRTNASYVVLLRALQGDGHVLTP